uniref:Beta-carotene 15,15'-monooxygenase n=1 Tax=Roseihalotalea indica TaxID=2867963 RepID=A0AA49GUG1_9BACT|nr:hypothetical protein K4G66_13105 [Tunicatimonas sp. TK19036]
MTFTVSRSSVWFFGIALSLILCEVFIVQSSVFTNSPHWLSFGVTADLTLGLPILYYFLIVRKQSINWVTTLLVFLLAIGIAHLILPGEHQYFLGFAEKAVIVTESVVLLYGLSRIRKIITAYRFSARKNPDVLQNLQYSLTQVLGQHKIIPFVVNEISMFYYSLFFWRARKEVRDHQTAFTYHKKSAYPALMGALLLVTAVETVGVHLLLSRWNEGVAWGFTILSAYSFLFIWADIVAVLKRPIVIEDNQLHLRIGLRWQAIIPLQRINGISPVSGNYTKDKSTLNLALLSDPNVILTFAEPVTVQGLYGMEKTVSRLALPLDDVKTFEKLLLERKIE